MASVRKILGWITEFDWFRYFHIFRKWPKITEFFRYLCSVIWTLVCTIDLKDLAVSYHPNTVLGPNNGTQITEKFRYFGPFSRNMEITESVKFRYLYKKFTDWGFKIVMKSFFRKYFWPVYWPCCQITSLHITVQCFRPFLTKNFDLLGYFTLFEDFWSKILK